MMKRARPAIVEEHRKYPRVHPAEDKPIEVHIMGQGFLDVLHARNISEGGIKIIVPHLFEGCDINADVELIIALPDTRSFRALGKIKHKIEDKSHGAFGVRFTRLADQDRRRIADYVARRLMAGAEA